MYKIAVIGTGYVGLVTGTCLSDFGMEVTCVDNDKTKIDSLNNGIIPIYEPGLQLIVERNTYYKRLKFSTDIKAAVEEADVVFIAVGTPPAEDGSVDLSCVYSCAEEIGSFINGYKVVVMKSTVPVGTNRKIAELIRKKLEARGVSYDFDVVSNPEFLREGTAVYDFTHPDRVVIGSDSDRAKEIMKGVYRVLYLNETPFVETDPETAEMIKYASNAFLAMKVTFINEIANLCEKVGADVQDVARAIGRDGRIGPKFLHAGPGFGGSCFPKDTRALADMGKKHGARLMLVESTISANERQKLLMVEKIEKGLGGVEGKTLGILGLAFKQNTNDMREAASITILNRLAEKGAFLRAYDPAAMEEAAKVFSNLKGKILFCSDEYDAVKGADAVVILTEWNQFRNLDLNRIKSLLKEPCFFDLRNIYRRSFMEQKGFVYFGVGQ